MHINAMSLEAMSLDVPKTPGHPNKMPFSGVLTRVGVPSDAPPHGSGDRLVMITQQAAEEALPTLLGMGVDLTASFDGHDAQAKVGFIEAATIEGDAIHIAGHIYAADFPAQAASIKRQKHKLGFSFEAKNIDGIDHGGETPIEITHLDFTGAAILLKDKAAYTTTSLAAAAANRGRDIMTMTPEELEAVIAKALAPVTTKVDELSASVADVKKTAELASVEASKSVMGMVEPRAKELESCAASMDAAGIGQHPTMGHATMLRKMAGSMRASAATGQVPNIYRDHNWGDLSASAQQQEQKPDPKIAELTDQVASLTTKLADLQASKTAASPAPERKTVAPGVSAQIDSILAKAGVKPGEDGKISVSVLDKALADMPRMTTADRMSLKTKLRAADLLAD